MPNRLYYISGPQRRIGADDGSTSNLPQNSVAVSFNYEEDRVEITEAGASGLSQQELEHLALNFGEWMKSEMSLFYKLLAINYALPKITAKYSIINTPAEVVDAARIFNQLKIKYNARINYAISRGIDIKQGVFPEWSAYWQQPSMQGRVGSFLIAGIIVAVVAIVWIIVDNIRGHADTVSRNKSESESDQASADRLLAFVEKHPEYAEEIFPLLKSTIDKVQTPPSKQSALDGLVDTIKTGATLLLIGWGIKTVIDLTSKKSSAST